MPAGFWDAQLLAAHEQTWPRQRQQDQGEIFRRSTHGELRKSLSCPSESRCTRQSSGTGLDLCKEQSEALAWFPGKENSVSQRRH